MMKKFLILIVTAVIACLATSCNEDAAIANTLEGTWSGNMYVSSNWNGRTYDATYTEITFLKDPYQYSSGTGYWVDYYSGVPWDYVANHIEWEVVRRTIRVYFVEENSDLEIYDYRLDRNHFTGYIYEGDHQVAFDLAYVSRRTYSDYHWGYDYWSPYYAPGTRADADSTGTGKPRRIIRSVR